MSRTVTIPEHFKRLFDFSGTEDRASFWLYAAVAFGIIIAVGMLIFIPMLLQAMEAMQQFAAENPDQAKVTSGPGHYSISISGKHPSFISTGGLVLYLTTTFGLAFLLYAAAVVRRLRDSGKSGFWGLLPLPFIIYSSVQMPKIFMSAGSVPDMNMTLFFSVFISNALYMVALVWLIVLLTRASRLDNDGEISTD